MYKVYLYCTRNKTSIWFFKEDFEEWREYLEVDVDALDRRDFLTLEATLFDCLRDIRGYRNEDTKYMVELAKYVFELGDRRGNV